MQIFSHKKVQNLILEQQNNFHQKTSNIFFQSSIKKLLLSCIYIALEMVPINYAKSSIIIDIKDPDVYDIQLALKSIFW